MLARAGCRADGVSSNGEVVVGSCTTGTGSEAISWTGNEDDAATALPLLSGGNRAGAVGANSNGLVIVGWAENSLGNEEAVRWVNGTVASFRPLASLESHQNRAYRTSSDGSITVGETDRTGEYDTAVVWVGNGSPTNIVAGAGHEWSSATGVSADGSLVVGYGIEASGGFTWTSDTGYSAHPGGVVGVSGDGRVIIGTNGGAAVRWIAREPESLGGVAQPLGVSGDGSVIVGRIGAGVFVWTETEGMRTLDAILDSLNVDLYGFAPASAADVSNDGTVVVGYGTLNGSEHAFRITLPAR